MTFVVFVVFNNFVAKKTFSIKEAVSYGWKKATSRLLFFILLFVIVAASSSLPSITAALIDPQQGGVLIFISQLAAWVIQILISIGLINIALRLYENKKTDYKDLFRRYQLIIPYFIASVIYSVIVVVGFILFIIPGFVWAIKFRYFSYLMIDRNLGPIDALKESGKITDGVKWKLLWFSLALVGINILGALALLVGLLVTVPLSMMAEVYVYKKLSDR